MQRSALRTNAKERFGDASNQVYADNYWNNRLQEAYRRVNGSNPFWPWLENRNSAVSIASGANSASLPTDFRRALAVFNSTDSVPMVEITGKREYRRLYPAGLVSTGVPIHYRFQANTIEVFPTPTGTTTLAIDYAAKPGTFSSDTDVPDWPEDWHDLLTEYALAFAYLDDGNLDQYQAHMAVFTAQLAELTRAILEARGDAYPQIDDNWFE